MALIAKDDGGGDFPICPEGQNQAVCVQIIDLGTQHNVHYDKYQRKVLLGIELPTVLNKENDNKPFLIWNRYTLNLGEKANLRRDLETWRGQAFTEDELLGFDLKRVLGAPCYVSVVHNTKGDKTYANINSIIKLPKEIPAAKPHSSLIYFDLEEPDMGAWVTFSEHLQKTICASPEAEAAGLSVGCETLSPPDQSDKTDTYIPDGSDGPYTPINEDDIPF